MNLASLFSGGKDSVFALYRAVKDGHVISCLVTMLPERDDSLFFHYPNAYCTLYQAECLGLPLISTKARCKGREQELSALEQALGEAKQHFGIDGVVSGGLASRFQQENFQQVCTKLGLKYYSPSWQVDQTTYMRELLKEKFVIIIVGVSAAGLDESWLGRLLDEQALDELEKLSRKYGFSVAFEGGEAETFVLDCPAFKHTIEIRNAKKHWDGVRGYFEILDAAVVGKGR